MKKALVYMGIGGLVAAIGLYLFPFSVGQEIFVDWLSNTSGMGYWYGVFLAMLIAGLLILGGYLLIRPGVITTIMRNPILLLGVVILIVLAFLYVIPFVSGLLGGA
jgi:hypothetical protein